MLVDDLVSCGAVKFGDFVLTSGKKSRYYVDIKKASSRPKILRRITSGFGERGIQCDKVAGVELGAVPLIVSYSLEYDKPFLIIRKGERDHGMKSPIEGDIAPGESVLLLEDVITSGGSVLRAIDMLEEAGAKVEAVLTVVDREEGGAERVSKRCAYHPLIRARELLARADME
ncbi:MAG: orotate phosphoribosyltransferase [Candidatus Thermoplasmatota archaeon]|nr:orotate phosphoribosyltransferase [Candidatus Thermoplasmatota archaeon]